MREPRTPQIPEVLLFISCVHAIVLFSSESSWNLLYHDAQLIIPLRAISGFETGTLWAGLYRSLKMPWNKTIFFTGTFLNHPATILGTLFHRFNYDSELLQLTRGTSLTRLIYRRGRKTWCIFSGPLLYCWSGLTMGSSFDQSYVFEASFLECVRWSSSLPQISVLFALCVMSGPSYLISQFAS